MPVSYNELLTRMKNKFTEESGLDADEAGDIGIRLRLLAGELYSLRSELEWIRRQMFPNTATGAQLDLHASQRGLSRRKGDKARGGVTFLLDTPLEFNMVIPAGTVCTNMDGSLNYVTVSDITIQRGQDYAAANVRAEDSGERYNAGRNSITTIVTYFSVGISIASSSNLWGGTDDEDDESLRARIMESLRNTPNGINSAYYEAIAMSVDGVYSAKAYRDTNQSGCVILTIGGRGAAPSQSVVSAVQTAMIMKTPLGISVLVQAASVQQVTLNVEIKVRSGMSAADVIAKTESRIEKYFQELSVGSSFYMSAVGKVIMEVDGVENFCFASGTQDIAANDDTLLTLGYVIVTEMT